MCRFHPYNNIHYTINTHCHSTLALEICYCYCHCCIYVGQQRAKAFNSAHCVRLFIIIIRIAIEGEREVRYGGLQKRVWTETDLYTYIIRLLILHGSCAWIETKNHQKEHTHTKKYEFSSMNIGKKKRKKKQRENVWRCVESDVEFLLCKSLHVLENYCMTMRLCRSVSVWARRLCMRYLCIEADLGKE